MNFTGLFTFLSVKINTVCQYDSYPAYSTFWSSPRVLNDIHLTHPTFISFPRWQAAKKCSNIFVQNCLCGVKAQKHRGLEQFSLCSWHQCHSLNVARVNEIDSHSSCLFAKSRSGTYPRFCLFALLAPGTYPRFLGSRGTYPPVFAHWTFVGTCR